MSHRNTLHSARSAPLSHFVIFAVARMVDDLPMADSRTPSHSDLDFLVWRCHLSSADPKTSGQFVDKAERVRTILSWAMVHALQRGERFAALLIDHVRSVGGFRANSANYIGREAIAGVCQAFSEKGYDLTSEGTLQARIPGPLEEPEFREMSHASKDSEVPSGNGVDVLEATVAQVLTERFGSYPQNVKFPTLLGHVFVEAGLVTSFDKPSQDEPPEMRFERALYEASCAAHALRDKEGHWLSNVTEATSAVATEVMGIIADHLLMKLSQCRPGSNQGLGVRSEFGRKASSGNNIVLLVEDDPTAREFLVAALQHLGFGVEACGTVRAASKFLEVEAPDVILADCNLPEMSGTELVRMSSAQNHGRPIIGMSGEHIKGNEMLKAGAMAFLEKPIELNRLQDVMTEAMAG